MATKSVENENMVKLKELTNKLSSSTNKKYSTIVKELKSIVDEGKKEVERNSNPQSKMKCYETMCSKITNILKNVELV
jgi:vacuolar-type H+-ATPase subunit H